MAAFLYPQISAAFRAPASVSDGSVKDAP